MGQDSEQERTLEQEWGLLAACDCGRDCDCDLDCHYDCDCDHDRDRVRSVDATRGLSADGYSTAPSRAVHDCCCPSSRRRDHGAGA